MKGFTLSEQQIKELRAAHKCERNRNAAYKINAVILLGTGWNLEEVSTALLLDEETLRSYVVKYQKDGLKTWTATHYKGRSSFLNAEQLDELMKELDAPFPF